MAASKVLARRTDIRKKNLSTRTLGAAVDCVRNAMAHAQETDFVFR
jgi:hypothetical protein